MMGSFAASACRAHVEEQVDEPVTSAHLHQRPPSPPPFQVLARTPPRSPPPAATVSTTIPCPAIPWVPGPRDPSQVCHHD